ncbi:hypothetical protein D8X77_20585 [Vibrio vulnificus]|nr:hypothetical protein [Vibrio vulnificus]PNM95881.1 hypothetical protein AL547_016320 [Vibrio vulnificus]POB50756.1 hypothetical protein CRN26_20540 [Vibrio vulnificus]HAS8145794.1 hypothetical protein [Vibrio vulnificus]HAS8222861.1 hypothetical protein [Vibrio vulnificus]
MTVDGTQPKSTDRSNPAILIYLGTTPPECSVLELRLHKTSAWAVLLFCKSLNIERFSHSNVNA